MIPFTSIRVHIRSWMTKRKKMEICWPNLKTLKCPKMYIRQWRKGKEFWSFSFLSWKKFCCWAVSLWDCWISFKLPWPMMFYLSGCFSMYFSVQGRQFNFQLNWKINTNLNCTHNIQHIIDTVWCFSLWWVEEDAWVRTFKICGTLWTHCCASQQVKQDCIEQTGNDFLAVGNCVHV